MENFYTAAKPFCVLAKFFGLFVMSQEGDTFAGFYKLKWQGIAYSIASFIVPTTLLLNIIFYHSSDIWLSKVWNIHTNFSTLMICLQFFYQIGKQQSILNFFSAVNDFDQKVKLNIKIYFISRLI